jgi:hypothetical protein
MSPYQGQAPLPFLKEFTGPIVYLSTPPAGSRPPTLSPPVSTEIHAAALHLQDQISVLLALPHLLLGHSSLITLYCTCDRTREIF